MNKNQIKFQFEILGEDVKAIAKKHHVSPDMIEYMVSTEKWQPLPIASALKTWKYEQNPAEDLLVQVREHSQLLDTLRHSEMYPQIMEVELQLLDRVRNFISIAETPAELKILSDIVKTLRPEVKTEGNEDGGLKIMVVNSFGDVGGPNAPIAISDNARKVSGDVFDGEQVEINI